MGWAPREHERKAEGWGTLQSASNIEDKNQLIEFELPIRSMKPGWVQKASLHFKVTLLVTLAENRWLTGKSQLFHENELSFTQRKVWNQSNGKSYTKHLIGDIISFNLQCQKRWKSVNKELFSKRRVLDRKLTSKFIWNWCKRLFHSHQCQLGEIL